MLGQSLNYEGLKSIFTILRNPKLLHPKLQIDDVTQIPFQKLKDSGVKAIAFDKDNTLTAPYESTIYLPFADSFERAKAVFGDKRICIVSNSAGSRDDYGFKHASMLENSMGVSVLRSKFKKPSLEHGMDLLNHFNLDANEIAVVGDRLMTDVVYANRLGAFSIYCRKIITTKGDNRIAAIIRSCEHYIIDRRNQKMKT
jgi:phosphatidylglycerophosphatase GEP4